MLTIWKSAGLATAFVALGGCELAAGIQDLQLVARDAGAEAGPDASSIPDLGVDSDSAQSDATSSNSASPYDANGDADSGMPPTGNAGDAVSDGADGGFADASDASVGGNPLDAGGVGAPADGGGGADSNLGAEAGLALSLVDDMESNGVPYGWLDGVNPANPLAGTWFVFSDGSSGGVISPSVGSPASALIGAIAGGRGASAHAAHISGNALFTVFGAGMGFNLNAATSTPLPYDASAYRGFTFWVRSASAVVNYVRLNVVDVNTAAPSSGGNCDGGACNGFWGSSLPALTSDWQQVTVFFENLGRPVWAVSDGVPLDLAHLIGCQFQINQGEAFDLWIDDIYFIDK